MNRREWFAAMAAVGAAPVCDPLPIPETWETVIGSKPYQVPGNALVIIWGAQPLSSLKGDGLSPEMRDELADRIMKGETPIVDGKPIYSVTRRVK